MKRLSTSTRARVFHSTHSRARIHARALSSGRARTCVRARTRTRARAFARSPFLLAAVTRAVTCAIFCAVICSLSLTGCSSETPTDNPGGISDTTDEEAANINLVNTTQLPDSSFLYDAQIADLQNSDSYLNGQTVQVTGEVVGDRIVSDYDPDFYWITLQATDGSYAEISVYMPESSTELIDMYGAYGKRGTILQVRGTFWAARSDHDGVTELEAQNVNIVEKGKITEMEFEPIRFIVGGILLIIGAGLAFLYWRLSERRR